MKVCIIATLFKVSDEWPKLYPETIAEGLSNDNEVIIITTKPFSGLNSLRPSVESRDGLKIYRFYPLNMYHWTFPIKHHVVWKKLVWHIIDIWNPHVFLVVRKILKKEKPDIVHTFNLSGLSTSVFSAIKSSKCRHIHTLVDCALISPWSTLIRNGKVINFNVIDKQYIKLRRFFSRSAHVVLASHPSLLNTHLEKGYFKNSTGVIFPQPIRLEPLALKDKSYVPFNILCVGAVSRGKGIYVLLEAFNNLGRNNANLHFVGGGPDLENLREETRSLSNIYVHGFMRDEDLTNMYSSANITVEPTIFPEDNPLVIIESFAFGTPVVASRINGIPDVIINGINGRLFEPGNSSELGDILRDLIDNRDKLEEMEAGALKSAEDYRLRKRIRILTEIYSMNKI